MLRGKFSNAILRLSNSCDVSGHSSTACELAAEIAGQESELSMGDMIAASETLLDLLGDSETSHCFFDGRHPSRFQATRR